jgi:hypothetical protein
MRVVLIACDGTDAMRWMSRQPHLGSVEVLWVGPRCPDRARGQTADAVLVTDLARLNLTDSQFALLLEQTLPAVAAAGA